MGWLDPLARAIGDYIERSDNQGIGFDRDIDLDGVAESREDPTNNAAQMIDDAFGGVFDNLEGRVLDGIINAGELTPENVEGAINEAEGDALELTVQALLGNLTIELAGGTQLESHQFMTSQILSYLALENVLGRRLGMYFEKGVDPALEAEVAKQTRSEFVSLPDAVEFALRKKEGDRGWLGGENTPPEVFDAIGSNEPVNRANILEEWGLRDDQRRILEETALAPLEPEELLEGPLQLGVIPDPQLVALNARRAGYPEAVIELFAETARQAPRSADAWEQRTSVEELVNQLDTLVDSGQISPIDARNALPEEVSEAAPALEERWRRITELPNKAPTRSQIESAFGLGKIDRSRFEELLGRVDIDPSEYPAITETIILDELDGDLYEAYGAGMIERYEYVNIAESVGVDQFAIDLLLSGESLSKVAEARNGQQAAPDKLRLQNVSGIGESREAQLNSLGIESVEDLANADPSTVADALPFQPDYAATLIRQAERMLQ